MKIAVLLLCLMVFGATIARADDVAEVKKLEIDLWESWHHHDPQKWADLTAPDYVWTDGKQTRGYEAVRKEFEVGKLEEYKTTEMQAVRVSPDVIILSYRAFMKGANNRARFESNVAECSVWVRRDGKWRNVLLQEVETSSKDTRVTPP